MTADSAKILGDPMFQLNVVLWMVQPAPPGSPIRPILREAGYLLSALSRNLPPPLELRPKLMALVGSDTAPAPDALAEPPAETPWLVIECKGTSFGPDSSTARQALKVLAVASDLRSSLALVGDVPRPGFVAYLTRLEDRDRLAETLRELTRRLVDAGLPASTSGVLGLGREDGGRGFLFVEPSSGNWPEPAASVLQPRARVMLLADDEDPRPLYLVPWDPSVEQEPEMREFCRAVLFARVTSEAIAVLGHETVPQRVVLKLEPLLSAATFRVSDRWRSKADLNRTIRDCKRFLVAALAPIRDRLSLAQPGDPDRIELTVRAQTDLNDAIDALERVDPFRGPAPEPKHQLSVLEPEEP
jgi:hypothetical protein